MRLEPTRGQRYTATMSKLGVRVQILGLLTALETLGACTPHHASSKEQPGPGPTFSNATLDDAHAVSVVEWGAGTDCSHITWCSASTPFERIAITTLDDWVGRLAVGNILLPQLIIGVVAPLFDGPLRALVAVRVEGPDNAAAYASTCGMEAGEAFAWPVDANAVWILDDDGSRLWELQCVLAVAGTLDASGKDPSNRSLKEALAARSGCASAKSVAYAEAQASITRVPHRNAQVTADNRCRQADAGI